jgi:hypothetical protein
MENYYLFIILISHSSPHEKDKCSDELHAQENQGCNRCARGGGGIQDIDKLINFTLTYCPILIQIYIRIKTHI